VVFGVVSCFCGSFVIQSIRFSASFVFFFSICSNGIFLIFVTFVIDCPCDLFTKPVIYSCGVCSFRDLPAMC